MKRRQVIGAIVASAIAPSATARNSHRTEKRLLGTWRSDKERTLERWYFKKSLDPAKRKKVEDMFGKLELRYTETHIDVTFEDMKHSDPYEVLASDEYSVVIQTLEDGKKKLQQIHFDGENSYYTQAGYGTEFFKRVEA